MCNGRGQAWLRTMCGYAVIKCECETCESNRTDIGTLAEQHFYKHTQMTTQQYLELKRNVAHGI